MSFVPLPECQAANLFFWILFWYYLPVLCPHSNRFWTSYDIKIVFCTGRECPSRLKFANIVSLGSISWIDYVENQQRIWKSFPLWLVYHAVGYYILMFKIYILVKTDCYNNFCYWWRYEKYSYHLRGKFKLCCLWGKQFFSLSHIHKYIWTNTKYILHILFYQ